MYSPDQPDADVEAYEAIGLAHQILTDPDLRREFDKLTGRQTEEVPMFAGKAFFEALSRSAALRYALLCVLYDRRRSKPNKPSISVRHLEGMLETGFDELSFALWYLKQRRLIATDDKSSLQITVEGMDFLEQNAPAPEIVMPLIKPASVQES